MECKLDELEDIFKKLQNIPKVRKLSENISNINDISKIDDIKLVNVNKMNFSVVEEMNELRERIFSYAQEINKLKTINNQLLITDKKYSNEILDLKGKIRVICRVKPNNLNQIKLIDKNIQIEDKFFKFDKIFYQNSAQYEIFDELSSGIKSVLDGYKICIFAYEQTGSGKTYTMEGMIVMTRMVCYLDQMLI